MTPRLRTTLLVQAGLRYCSQNFIMAVLRRRGDEDAGILMVKVDRLDGTGSLFAPMRLPDGALQWRRITGEDWLPDAAIEQRLEKELSFDPDMWIVEVEDREGRNPFAALT